MCKIDRKLLEQEAKKNTAKSDKLQDNQEVLNAVIQMFDRLKDVIMELCVYNAVQWFDNIDRWIANLSTENTKTYKRGEIVFLDLGAQNFRYEPSYKHACIVLANRPKSVLIVPCSSKKYDSKHKDIIDATIEDGFLKNTGIQTESFRWVNKNRIVAQTGNKVSNRVLNLLDEAFLSLIPTYKKEVRQHEHEKKILEERVAELEAQLEKQSFGMEIKD